MKHSARTTAKVSAVTGAASRVADDHVVDQRVLRIKREQAAAVLRRAIRIDPVAIQLSGRRFEQEYAASVCPTRRVAIDSAMGQCDRGFPDEEAAAANAANITIQQVETVHRRRHLVARPVDDHRAPAVFAIQASLTV